MNTNPAQAITRNAMSDLARSRSPKKSPSPERQIYNRSISKEEVQQPERKLKGTQITVQSKRENSSDRAQKKRKREEPNETAHEERTNKRQKMEQQSVHIETSLRNNPNSSKSREKTSRTEESMPTRYSSQQRPVQNQVSHYLPMKGVEYLNYIKEGIKTHEGRVYRGTCSKMREGDTLTMKDNRARKGITCRITSCDKYPSFEAMLKAKGVLNMLPQLKGRASQLNAEELIDAGVKIYESFPGAQGVHQLGAIAIGVKYLSDL